MINISEGGVGVVAEKSIYPGTEVYITFKYIDDYSIYGIVRWPQLYHEDDKTCHRMGIEVEKLVIESEDGGVVTSERAEFVNMILSKNNK